jgi:uncharacterized protein YecA (UPF0149 family)
LIENREADEWVRDAGIRALAMLTAHGMLPRDELMSYYKELLETRLEKEAQVERTSVAVQATDLGPAEVYQLIKEGYEDGTIDDSVMYFSSVEAALEKDPQELLEKYRRENPLVEDTVKEMEWWASFQDTKSRSLPISELLYGDDLAESHEPYVAPEKVGRNDPCPCGSGKKYKRCHGA